MSPTFKNFDFFGGGCPCPPSIDAHVCIGRFCEILLVYSYFFQMIYMRYSIWSNILDLSQN